MNDGDLKLEALKARLKAAQREAQDMSKINNKPRKNVRVTPAQRAAILSKRLEARTEMRKQITARINKELKP